MGGYFCECTHTASSVAAPARFARKQGNGFGLVQFWYCQCLAQRPTRKCSLNDGNANACTHTHKYNSPGAHTHWQVHHRDVHRCAQHTTCHPSCQELTNEWDRLQNKEMLGYRGVRWTVSSSDAWGSRGMGSRGRETWQRQGGAGAEHFKGQLGWRLLGRMELLPSRR